MAPDHLTWTWLSTENTGRPPHRPGTIAELLAATSLSTREAQTVFACWGRQPELTKRRPTLAEQLAAVGVAPHDRFFVERIGPSPTPIESGLLEALHLRSGESVPSIEDGEPVEATLHSFAEEQAGRYDDQDRFANGVEGWLEAHYGTLTPEQTAMDRFRLLDYPAFDNGTPFVGFGLLAQHAPPRPHARSEIQLWFWSRVVHAHK